MLALPQCARNGGRRLWLTKFLGSGFTGNVFQARFNGSDEFFAVNVFEMYYSDADIREQFLHEFDIYRMLEEAYRSEQLSDCITPCCYGAFEGDGMAIFILELCANELKRWDEFNAFKQFQVYELAKQLTVWN
ncbi:hypothetical protein K503DRAFT_806082 [Rhizopogon vinicolor AM-OR11-026]|uniref:Protein kinase domain-containing protein n=1 Tax=Rhizopogon vinicolor AM-OR11-026 TaxID=1314800 RepID=A0A1B7MFP3_9AGAM|nr:hypothetical protein K503DRAFT_806082 [Rhizopogon vinicolor AM-OR11-026]